jgi:hypothetical protein
MRGRSATFSNAVSALALFVALGGTAYAVDNLKIGTKQLKAGAVTTSKIADGAVTGAKLDDASLGPVPSALSATHADTAAHADGATHADTADNATHAGTADSATHAGTADSATHAGTADNATHAAAADNATHAAAADNATHAATAENATTVGGIGPAGFVPSGAITRFGPVVVNNTLETMAVGASFTFGFSCDLTNVGDSAFLDLTSSEDNWAYNDVVANGTPSANGGVDLQGGTILASGQELGVASAPSGAGGIISVIGNAVAPSGKQISYDVYAAVDAAGHARRCVYGGTVVLNG